MSVQLALLLAAVAPSYLGDAHSHRPLATMAPYPSGRADSVHRPGFNGKLWISRPMIGGQADNLLLGWPEPGPAAYGAAETDGSVVYARLDQVVVGFSPWVKQDGRALLKQEHARNVWLAENGYTGGVRTFVNDAYMPREVMASAEPVKARPSMEPAAIMERPIDLPRFKTRMDVMALPKGATLAQYRVSWPLGTPAAVLARQMVSSDVRVAQLDK
jgi:hypothetical protein